ncbi:hypothetical protein CCP4SC76_2290008 [Gammaproteobacteria bacterium]
MVAVARRKAAPLGDGGRVACSVAVKARGTPETIWRWLHAYFGADGSSDKEKDASKQHTPLEICQPKEFSPLNCARLNPQSLRFPTTDQSRKPARTPAPRFQAASG